MKCAFFVGEEIGCVGSSRVDLDFFRDCRFIIEPDRMNGHDLITSMMCGDVCSEDFIKDIGAEKFGYVEEEGSITDVGELVESGVGISCLNLSCGYYAPHTDREYTNLAELENCLNFVRHIVQNCTKVYPFEYEPYVYPKDYGRGYGYYGTGSAYTKTYRSSRWDDEYTEDYDIMEDIIVNDPYISFHEIYSEWAGFFHDKSYVGLKEIYDDIKGSYGYIDYHAPSFLEDEDDVFQTGKSKVS